MIEVRSKKNITIDVGRTFTFEKQKSFIQYEPENMKFFNLFYDDGHKITMVPIDMVKLKIKSDLTNIIKMVS